MKHFVYSFSEAISLSRDVLGGKGFGLAQMTSLNLPVPPGFIISTEACNQYYLNGNRISDDLKQEIMNSIHNLENQTGKKLYSLNDSSNFDPLLLSARSGAKISMPGMMDTILNIGITRESYEYIKNKSNNESFASDIYLRFLQMFFDVYAKISKEELELQYKSLNSIDDKILAAKKYYKEKMNEDFPEDPYEQLFLAIEAVFKSWNNDRAIYYRKIHNIPDNCGTAVTIQSMVFGNYGQNSGTGVAFTRNPSSGEKHIFGEYLINAQGEDVVAGIRTPSKIDFLKDEMPEVFDQFIKASETLESYFNDMQDMEFTIENGKFYLLQTRTGKRSPAAALKISLDFLKEGKISEIECLSRIDPMQIKSLLHSQFNDESLKNAVKIASGLPASPGAAVGKVVFDSKKASECHSKGDHVILVRNETSAEDIEGMNVSEGILTIHGGMTSHAAVVARGMGKCCVSGCESISIHDNKLVCGNISVSEGDYISLDGSSGAVYLGKIELESFKFSNELSEFLNIAKKHAKIKVMANADTPESVKIAISLGADGIGLCRTEHMFFDKSRINFMREMIISQSVEQRKKALDKLFVFQKDDFYNMFLAANGKGVTIRLLDPPLHEFLPKSDDEVEEMSKVLNIDSSYIKSVSNQLKEFNPMMGHRGCRLLISYPEIADMQVRSIIGASIEASKKLNIEIIPEIMIPLVGDVKEVKFLKNIIIKSSESVMQEYGSRINYKIGTMIETPRAALLADEIAREVDFFSFGTNDLTQMTFGFSRDDSQKFLKNYYEQKIYEFDPFVSIDQKGVGYLIKMAIKLGRQENPSLKIGICGEHAGDPSSIEFLKSLDLDYVSCSPFRVPSAILKAIK